MNYKLILITFLHLILTGTAYSGRSIFRPKDSLMPEIITSWEGESKTNHFKDSHLEESAIFMKFDYDHFMSHLLPQGPIEYRVDKSKTVLGKTLDNLANGLVNELYEHKKIFTDFITLKDNDFNYKIISGDLVLKFKDYPFVIKLFIETPESFVKPFSKGWQPAGFFLMSGGLNRYLSGFTRIKNRDISRQKINADPYWSTKNLDFPRKWSGLYKNQTWFILQGKNIGQQPHEIKLPSIYWIICDEIKEDKSSDITQEESPTFALDLSNSIDNRLDPHGGNILIEEKTGSRVIIDTEHFPSMVGLKKRVKFTSYTHWYCTLGSMALEAQLLRHKYYRRNLQKNPTPVLP
jgi:hypothetical protein